MVLVVALLVLGPTKLPDAARHVGAAINVYRELRDRVNTEFSPSALVDRVLGDDGPGENGPGEPGDAESSTGPGESVPDTP
jgi:hypothetical protein